MSEKIRCGWCGNDKLYQDYHDNLWGKPVYDDAILFEFLLLEGFQAGLSWITILKRREGFRAAFDNFDYKKIAQYDEKKLQALMTDERIIKNKLKIQRSEEHTSELQSRPHLVCRLLLEKKKKKKKIKM